MADGEAKLPAVNQTRESPLARAEPRRHAITIAECAQMAAAGVFLAGLRMELIEGELIEMAPIGDAHANLVSAVAALLIEALGARRVRIQQPLVLNDTSRPEPDIVVLREPMPLPPHLAWCPAAAEAALVVEVADSSLAHDRRKAALYAAAGVQATLVIDVQGRSAEYFADPAEGSYSQQQRLGAGDVVHLHSVGVTMALENVFAVQW